MDLFDQICDECLGKALADNKEEGEERGVSVSNQFKWSALWRVNPGQI